MTREEVWSDAGDIMESSGTARLWPYYMEIALSTSLTQDEAEAKLLNGVQGLIGELLYEYGDYGKGEGE